MNLSGAEWTALAVAVIGAFGTIFLQALSLILSHLRGKRAERAVKENTVITEAVLEKQDAQHVQTNSRMDQLLDKTDKAGQLAGRAAEKAEVAAKALAKKKEGA